MAYERLSQPLATRAVYMKRVAANLGLAGSLMLVSLVVGMGGYMHYGPMGWDDAFANASMIMSGMGPLADMKTTGGKLFEGAYALYSGLFLIISASLILGPVVHRFLHQMHLADEDESGDDDDSKKPARKSSRS